MIFELLENRRHRIETAFRVYFWWTIENRVASRQFRTVRKRIHGKMEVEEKEKE